MTFDEAFDLLLGHEGGFVNDSRDPGGCTRWGITQRVAIQEGYTGDMRVFPVEKAKDIAKKRYWDAVRADDMPPCLRYALFDAAYNSGPSQAVKWLQRAVGVQDDGIVGPMTIAAASRDPLRSAMLMTAERLDFLTSLPTFAAFGKGWTRRIAAVLKGIA